MRKRPTVEIEPALQRSRALKPYSYPLLVLFGSARPVTVSIWGCGLKAVLLLAYRLNPSVTLNEAPSW